MKSIRYVLIIVLSFFTAFIVADAAPSSSISVNKSQIESGQSVTATVTIKNAASWNIKINGTGNTNSCSTSAADATGNGKNATKSFSLTCKSNSTGVIRISYSGDITSEDGNNVSVSGFKTVSVVTPRVRSNNNNLKSLWVDGGVLVPDFNQDTLEYSVTFEPGSQKAVINGEKADGYASINGLGEKDLVEGDNRFEVVVTSETGNTKTYVVNVIVKEYEPVKVNVGSDELTLVRKKENLKKPETFEEATVQIDENVFPAFYNEKLDITLVGLKDENGNISLYQYDDGNYKKFNELSSKKLFISIIDTDVDKFPKGYNKYEFKFNDEIFIGYKLTKNSNFALVYGIDEFTGEKNIYQVDIKNSTVSLFNRDYEKILDKYNNFGYIVSGALLFVIFVEFLIILLSKHKNKKIVKKVKKEKIEKVKEEAIKDAKSETVESKKKEKKLDK